MVYETVTYDLYLAFKHVLAGWHTAHIPNTSNKIRACESLSKTVFVSSRVQPKM